MINEPPTVMSRLRAVLARVLASFAAGARRLEHWTARGTRPMLVAVIVVAVLAAGLIAVVSEGRHVAGWMRGGPEIGRGHRGPEPKPFGKPHGDREGRPDRRSAARPVGKPELPPPPPASSDAPPPPPRGGR